MKVYYDCVADRFISVLHTENRYRRIYDFATFDKFCKRVQGEGILLYGDNLNDSSLKFALFLMQQYRRLPESQDYTVLNFHFNLFFDTIFEKLNFCVYFFVNDQLVSMAKSKEDVSFSLQRLRAICKFGDAHLSSILESGTVYRMNCWLTGVRPFPMAKFYRFLSICEASMIAFPINKMDNKLFKTV